MEAALFAAAKPRNLWHAETNARLPATQEHNLTAADQALSIYRERVRQCLGSAHGYECQEAEGDFMLAFQHPIQALQFCIQLQDALMHCSWGTDILQLPKCQVEVKNHVMLWNGPRVAMGVCEGQPASVSPHTTSGRADYFGPVVNR